MTGNESSYISCRKLIAYSGYSNWSNWNEVSILILKGVKMSDNKLHGYSEAEKIDDRLNDLLDEHKIVKDSLPEWRNLVRTIHTSLNLIGERVELVEAAGKDEDYVTRLRTAAVNVLSNPKNDERTIEVSADYMRELLIII